MKLHAAVCEKAAPPADSTAVSASPEERLMEDGKQIRNGSITNSVCDNGCSAGCEKDECDRLDHSSYSLLNFNDAPSYLKFNPYIRTGYRGYLTTKMCLESVFWWTNETINIWSHIFGWMLFLGLTLYDLVLLNIHASFADKFIVGVLLGCFQICMILSSLYHTFSCRSEKDYLCFLSFDLFGIALSLLAIYMSGVYYAFWCHKNLQLFYLLTVSLIFLFAMIIQIPRLRVDANMKLIVFVCWAAYGVVPTFHWTVIMGGYANPVVQLLLPRVLGMYAISGLAFFIYMSKIPERFFSGKVDYIGSSHQWWHLFVVLALYYWHNTGIKYVEFRMNHGCANDMRL
ncbi:progestin and adipoQ receptor family member 3-like isoform X1 [Schistocerca americana]|uniref:progestin and adipoQ receptor family member 3-like isoform X1 n=1 Tax=Schistocerca americana TaxID=7009 RepID=UPI001F4FB5A0|nr:progestin and adipoQ receptor family member 3-like isoform X1 [Schistocerca americana]XP_047116507.1 progestin and adipoQ receptor family member 3-like isoform X1 [Schistocerca piceifrons]